MHQETIDKHNQPISDLIVIPGPSYAPAVREEKSAQPVTGARPKEGLEPQSLWENCQLEANEKRKISL
jgi:hypothetical protein